MTSGGESTHDSAAEASADAAYPLDSVTPDSVVKDSAATPPDARADVRGGGEHLIHLGIGGGGAGGFAGVRLRCGPTACYATLPQLTPYDYGKGTVACAGPAHTVLLRIEGGAVVASTCVDDVKIEEFAVTSSGIVGVGYEGDGLAKDLVAQVVRLDPSGVVLDRKRLKASTPTTTTSGRGAAARSMAVDPLTGDLLLSLEWRGTLDLDGTPIPGNLAVVRLSASLVAKFAVGPSAGHPDGLSGGGQSAVAAVEGGAVLAFPSVGAVRWGARTSTTSFTTQPGLTLATIDAKGLPLALRTFGTDTEVGPPLLHVARASKEAIFVHGYSSSAAFGCAGAFVASFARGDLAMKWIRCWPTARPGGVDAGMAIEASGEVVVTDAIDAAGQKATVRRYSPTGELLRTVESTTHASNQATDLVIADGQLRIAGWCRGDFALPSLGLGPIKCPSDGDGAFYARLAWP